MSGNRKDKTAGFTPHRVVAALTLTSHLATKPHKVGRAVPSAPRRFRRHSICAVFVNSIGALGTARPTFWLSFHSGNRPLTLPPKCGRPRPQQASYVPKLRI